ncbi:hypothetical protein J4Q44_G00071720 [Coregonus suidteri]|uniref:Uncharacterized protein n=1 Tax=Coregonus suidteri TaxID=861788 RepID=A0AAN8M0J9_9TELE
MTPYPVRHTINRVPWRPPLSFSLCVCSLTERREGGSQGVGEGVAEGRRSSDGAEQSALFSSPLVIGMQWPFPRRQGHWVRAELTAGGASAATQRRGGQQVDSNQVVETSQG